MNVRTPYAVRLGATNSPAVSLLEFEIPINASFERLAQQLDTRLAALEERFNDYVTYHSLARSIGR